MDGFWDPDHLDMLQSWKTNLPCFLCYVWCGTETAHLVFPDQPRAAALWCFEIRPDNPFLLHFSKSNSDLSHSV